MYRKRTYEEINAKCEFLESLGFDIQHQDSNVIFILGDTGTVLEFDFSASGKQIYDIMISALYQAHKQGLEEGKKQIQNQMKRALGLDDHEEV